MADLVAISANEMKFFLKRSLEGMGFNPGEQIEAGRRMATVWQYGLADSQLLWYCLQHLQPQIKHPLFVSQQDQVWTFDGLGQSALVQAELAVGRALAKQAKQVIINNIHDGVLLAPALMGWLSIPLANAPWQISDAHTDQPVLVLYFQQQAMPHLSHAEVQTYALAIGAQGQLQGLYQAPTDYLLPAAQVRIHIGSHLLLGECIANGATLQAHRAMTLAKGLRVDSDLLDHLKTLIIASFVPESADSQAGAGPG